MILSRGARCTFLLSFTVGTLSVTAAAEPNDLVLPQGWKLVHEEHFDSEEALKRFVMTDPNAWRFSADGRRFTLELAAQSKYQPPVRSPANIALIADRQFGDFVLEVDLVQTGREYGHRDMCLFFGVQDPQHFYYVHLATAADDHAHNIFIVNGAPRTRIARETTSGVNWGLDVWHQVRLERRLSHGTIRVLFDGKQVMSGTDQTFGAGWVGFGSFDDTGRIDNVRIWSDAEPRPQTATFFPRFPGKSE